VSDAELSGFIAAVVDGGAANAFSNANVDYIGAVDGDFNMDAMTYSALTSHGLEFASNTSVTTSAGTELNINFADDSSSLG
jgi:hypothetical protein